MRKGKLHVLFIVSSAVAMVLIMSLYHKVEWMEESLISPMSMTELGLWVFAIAVPYGLMLYSFYKIVILNRTQ